MRESLMAKARKFSSYSLALDKSTDIWSAAQLAIFIYGVNDYFEITEELNAFAMKSTLWEMQIKNKNFVHFPTLQNLKV